ncbi:MAG: hypothetical protein K9L70_03125 [Thiohalocapsa sp.]|nr:hypothetical protein [Thiohalocapsa sp.]MCF7992967.1 hypothetical protein [Thiohalocapsa sp.]
MFTKLLVTAAVVYFGYLVYRARRREADPERAAERPLPRFPRVPSRFLMVSAYGLLTLMLVASTLYLYRDWTRSTGVVDLQVVNPYTGDVQRYQARRGDIDGRTFRTVDGRVIRIAEMERLIIAAPPP